MTDVSDLVRRNADFATSTFGPGLRINPSGNLMVIGCVDPRVDPAHVLGLEHGEAAVIRNVGGRVTPATFRTLSMLGKVGQAHAEGRPSGDWNLVILHHTDCGMVDLAPFPDLLAGYFETSEQDVPGELVTDPVASVRLDVDKVRRATRASDFLVSGLVYDVDTGLVDVVVPSAHLDLP